MLYITINDTSSLAKQVTQKLGMPLHTAQVQRYADGEMRVVLQEPDLYSGQQVCIIQSTSAPVLEHIALVAFLADELRNAGAQHVRALVPYFGYARQEKSGMPGKPGPAALIAKWLEAAGIAHIMSVVLHTEAIKQFFSIPVENVTLEPFIAQYIKAHIPHEKKFCLVAPDKGAAAWVQNIAQQIGADYMVFEKERYGINKTRVVSCSGSCGGNTAIIIDDIIDTGGTALHVAQELKTMGMQDIYGLFVHPVLSGDALQKVEHSVFKQVFVGNTIAVVVEHVSKITVFDVSTELATLLKSL